MERDSEVPKEKTKATVNVSSPVAIQKDCELPKVGDYIFFVLLPIP